MATGGTPTTTGAAPPAPSSTSGSRLQVARELHPAARAARLAARRARDRWRRSLQTRVVVTTLVASAIVVGLLASLLLDQVGRGLVDTKTRTALSEAQSGVAQAQTRRRIGFVLCACKLSFGSRAAINGATGLYPKWIS